jgi:chemotaxis protein CheD
VKIFGGGRIMENMTDVGLRNITFVRDYLKAERLQVLAEDVGDIFPRMLVYFPQTGRVKVKRLRSLHNNVIAAQEKKYIDSVADEPVSGDIELF